MSQLPTQTARRKRDDLDEDEVLGKAYDPRIVARTWVYVHPYRMHMAAAVGLMILIAVCSLSQPFLTKLAIDRIQLVAGRASAGGGGIQAGDLQFITLVALGYVVCALGS